MPIVEPSATVYGPPASTVGPARPASQSLAAEVRTTISTSPSACRVRLSTHGSGVAPGPAQSLTSAELRTTKRFASGEVVGKSVGSSRNAISRGLEAEADGALIRTSLPAMEKPLTEDDCVSLTETVPATGVVSVVSIGSVGVAPSLSTSVVTVVSAGTLTVKL